MLTKNFEEYWIKFKLKLKLNIKDTSLLDRWMSD